MKKENFLLKQLQKGVNFSLVVIFIVLIGFHVVIADLFSNLLGVSVQRGVIPGVLFMVFTHLLMALIFGWNASDKRSPSKQRRFQGLITSASIALMIGLFSILLNILLESRIDIRKYLTALSFENMDYFLLKQGTRGSLIIPGIYLGAGILANVLAITFQSDQTKELIDRARKKIAKLFEFSSKRWPKSIAKYWKYMFSLAPAILLLILPLKWGSYMNYVTGLVGLYFIAGLGLNIIVGLSGQLMLGYAALLLSVPTAWRF